MDLRTRQTRRLTGDGALDTGPCYSPDGREIVFEIRSRRHASSSTSWVRTAPTCSVSAWATAATRPRSGRRAATTSPSPSSSQGRFLIGVMRPDGSGERVLTEGYHNEGPTWAPNGRVLMFFRESQGETGGPRIYSVDLTGYNERVVTDAVVRLRSGLVAAPEVKHALTRPYSLQAQTLRQALPYPCSGICRVTSAASRRDASRPGGQRTAHHGVAFSHLPGWKTVR